MAASIITSVKGDVTYDGIPDTVSLIGQDLRRQKPVILQI